MMYSLLVQESLDVIGLSSHVGGTSKDSLLEYLKNHGSLPHAEAVDSPFFLAIWEECSNHEWVVQTKDGKLKGNRDLIAACLRIPKSELWNPQVKLDGNLSRDNLLLCIAEKREQGWATRELGKRFGMETVSQLRKMYPVLDSLCHMQFLTYTSKPSSRNDGSVSKDVKYYVLPRFYQASDRDKQKPVEERNVSNMAARIRQVLRATQSRELMVKEANRQIFTHMYPDENPDTSDQKRKNHEKVFREAVTCMAKDGEIEEKRIRLGTASKVRNIKLREDEEESVSVLRKDAPFEYQVMEAVAATHDEGLFPSMLPNAWRVSKKMTDVVMRRLKVPDNTPTPRVGLTHEMRTYNGSSSVKVYEVSRPAQGRRVNDKGTAAPAGNEVVKTVEPAEGESAPLEPSIPFPPGTTETVFLDEGRKCTLVVVDALDYVNPESHERALKRIAENKGSSDRRERINAIVNILKGLKSHSIKLSALRSHSSLPHKSTGRSATISGYAKNVMYGLLAIAQTENLVSLVRATLYQEEEQAHGAGFDWTQRKEHILVCLAGTKLDKHLASALLHYSNDGQNYTKEQLQQEGVRFISLYPRHMRFKEARRAALQHQLIKEPFARARELHVLVTDGTSNQITVGELIRERFDIDSWLKIVGYPSQGELPAPLETKRKSLILEVEASHPKLVNHELLGNKAYSRRILGDCLAILEKWNFIVCDPPLFNPELQKQQVGKQGPLHDADDPTYLAYTSATCSWSDFENVRITPSRECLVPRIAMTRRNKDNGDDTSELVTNHGGRNQPGNPVLLPFAHDQGTPRRNEIEEFWAFLHNQYLCAIADQLMTPELSVRELGMEYHMKSWTSSGHDVKDTNRLYLLNQKKAVIDQLFEARGGGNPGEDPGLVKEDICAQWKPSTEFVERCRVDIRKKAWQVKMFFAKTTSKSYASLDNSRTNESMMPPVMETGLRGRIRAWLLTRDQWDRTPQEIDWDFLASALSEKATVLRETYVDMLKKEQNRGHEQERRQVVHPVDSNPLTRHDADLTRRQVLLSRTQGEASSGTGAVIDPQTIHVLASILLTRKFKEDSEDPSSGARQSDIERILNDMDSQQLAAAEAYLIQTGFIRHSTKKDHYLIAPSLPNPSQLKSFFSADNVVDLDHLGELDMGMGIPAGRVASIVAATAQDKLSFDITDCIREVEVPEEDLVEVKNSVSDQLYNQGVLVKDENGYNIPRPFKIISKPGAGLQQVTNHGAHAVPWNGSLPFQPIVGQSALRSGLNSSVKVNIRSHLGVSDRKNGDPKEPTRSTKERVYESDMVDPGQSSDEDYPSPIPLAQVRWYLDIYGKLMPQAVSILQSILFYIVRHPDSTLEQLQSFKRPKGRTQALLPPVLVNTAVDYLRSHNVVVLLQETVKVPGPFEHETKDVIRVRPTVEYYRNWVALSRPTAG